MVQWLFGFAMVLARVSAFFLLLPVFGSRSVPVRIKVAVTVLLALFFTVAAPVSVGHGHISLLHTIILLANEATYGLALGLTVTFVFSVVKLCGRIVERQMGLAMAQVMDPLTGETTQPLGSLLEMIFIILFLSANGHHFFVLILSRSYDVFPAGSIPTVSSLTAGVVQSSSVMFVAGLRLAAPMLAAFLVMLVAMALLARLVPEMNILFISLPLRVGLGLLMMMIFLPLLNGYVAEFADWMTKLLPV